MGKSPGKWIKTAFFGKKSSKSSIPKKAVLQEEAIDILSDDAADHPSVLSDQPPDTSDKSGENSEPEMGISENVSHNGVVSLPGTQDANREGTLEWNSLDSDQIAVLEQAAMKAQAAFRGYWARRAFHALKVIIALQAVIRGDLVRRQAIANLLGTQGHWVSCQAEQVPEESQNEIERVRRNLKKLKVSGSSTKDRRKSETKTFRQKPSPRKVSGSPAPDVPQKGVHVSTEKKSSAVVPVLKVSEQPKIQTTPNSYIAEETLDVPDSDHLGVELNPPENGHEVEKAPMVDEEQNCKEDDQNNKENQRIRRRRSFPLKKGFGENASDNSPTLPSYMAATESAKAKLRSQGSPRFGQDGDENGFYRQTSFPSSTDGRLSSSMSSQTQKLAQENGRGNKNFKSKLSSRDGHEKVVQPGWKR